MYFLFTSICISNFINEKFGSSVLDLQSRFAVRQGSGRAADILAYAYEESEKIDDPEAYSRFVVCTVRPPTPVRLRDWFA